MAISDVIASWWTTGARSAERLSAMLCAAGVADYVRVGEANSADGSLELRIETETGGVVTVTRWRPPLLRDVSIGTARLDDLQARIAAVLARAADAMAIDVGAASREELLGAAQVLRVRVRSLRERIEARSDAGLDISAQTAALTNTIAKLSAIRLALAGQE